MEILLAGEALIDFKPLGQAPEAGFRPHAGGSPLNVAVGLSRLGRAAGFLGCLSRDPFGELLEAHARRNGVDARFVRRRDAPSTLAFVYPEEGGERYSFYGAGAADTQLAVDELPASLPEELAALHLGSIAMARQPIGEALAALMAREHSSRLVSFDPNVRPDVVPDLETYRGQLEGWLAHVDLVKASRVDLSLLYPDEPLDRVAARWLGLGPTHVAVTRGGEGALGFTREASVEVPGRPVEVVDTVGAGDAFTSGLLAWLLERGLAERVRHASLPERQWKAALAFATEVAALTCARAGADPPQRDALPRQ